MAGAEEIRRLFDAEQKHVAEMRTWLQQKESLERDNDDATKQIEELERELDNRNKELERTKIEKESVEKTLATTKRQEEDLHERLTAAQQELGIRRVAEQTHKVSLEDSTLCAVNFHIPDILTSICRMSAMSGFDSKTSTSRTLQLPTPK